MHLRAYLVARFYSRHFFADTFDNAAKFMAQRYWRFNASLRPTIPSIDMQVRTANRSRRYAYQDVSGANRGDWRRFKRQSGPRSHFAQGIHLPRLSDGHLSRLPGTRELLDGSTQHLDDSFRVVATRAGRVARDIH